MKKYLKYMLIASLFHSIAACSPSEYDNADLDNISIDAVDRAELVRSHNRLICDGNAQIELTPVLYTKKGDRILPTRVKDEWLEFSSAEVPNISKLFSTSDRNLIGKTIHVTLKIKGKNIKAEPIEFQVVEPQADLPTIKIPIIFHIAQTMEDVESFGGNFESVKIYNLINRLNNVFNGSVSRNAAGVNTKIEFIPALYSQDGRKLSEEGINRVVVKEIPYKTMENFILSEKLVWPADKYMNIWLISDRKNLVKNFGTEFSMLARPNHVNSGVNDIPEGLELNELEGELPTFSSGLFYRLQLLNELTFSSGSVDNPGVNELIHYIGIYLGLMDTFTFNSDDDPANDFCDDTLDYSFDKNTIFFSLRWYNESLNCFFQLENIMDDPTGVHRSISKDQNQRMRWVLNNCPERNAWKSNFALTGK